MIRGLRAAVRFLTRVPVPGAVTTAEDLPHAIGWFPLVGAGVGAAIGGVATLALPWWDPAIAAVLAIAVGLLLTGGFHEDAASDAADGLGGGFTTERVLEIMRDSRIGAYGAMTLWVVLSLRALLLWRALEVLPSWTRLCLGALERGAPFGVAAALGRRPGQGHCPPARQVAVGLRHRVGSRRDRFRLVAGPGTERHGGRSRCGGLPHLGVVPLAPARGPER